MKRFLRHLLVIAALIVLVVLGHYFGWLREAPPLLAPGRQ